jgi:hypothetical protein
MSRRLVAEVDRNLGILNGCPPGHAKECVYVLVQRSGGGYVKIGTTVDLNTRTGDHQGNAFGELRLVAAFHGSYGTERSLHERFEKARIWGHREHFAQTRAVKRWVADLDRLNGRDGECWTCRARAREIRERPWTGFRLPKFRVAAETRDMRCGPECRVVHAWFNRSTSEFAFGSPKPGGHCSLIPGETARSLFSAESHEAWAINLWVLACDRHHSIGSRSLASDLRDTRNGGTGFAMHPEDIAMLRGASPEIHHSSTKFFPDHESFPSAPEVVPLPEAVGHLEESMDWLANDFLARYGAVQFCGCESNGNLLRRLDLQIGAGDSFRGPGIKLLTVGDSP